RDAVLAAAREVIAKATLARLDYAELRDPETLAEAPERLAAPALLALAVFLPRREGDGSLRLIDNRVLLAPAREDRS
ncbi:MAG: pantoate--beta-alanine ligase, partial [Myxococcota bacterium]